MKCANCFDDPCSSPAACALAVLPMPAARLEAIPPPPRRGPHRVRLAKGILQTLRDSAAQPGGLPVLDLVRELAKQLGYKLVPLALLLAMGCGPGTSEEKPATKAEIWRAVEKAMRQPDPHADPPPAQLPAPGTQ